MEYLKGAEVPRLAIRSNLLLPNLFTIGWLNQPSRFCDGSGRSYICKSLRAEKTGR